MTNPLMRSIIKIFLLGCHPVKGKSAFHMQFFLIESTFLHDLLLAGWNIGSPFKLIYNTCLRKRQMENEEGV
jgi:hypothetical protein